MTAIALDIGGSMAHRWRHMVVALQKIAEYPFRLVAFDDSVRKMAVIHSADSLAVFFRDIPFGGGTSFTAVFDVLETGGDTDLLVFYSDGYGPEPKNAPSFPVFWASEFLETLPPFGEICA